MVAIAVLAVVLGFGVGVSNDVFQLSMVWPCDTDERRTDWKICWRGRTLARQTRTRSSNGSTGTTQLRINTTRRQPPMGYHLIPAQREWLPVRPACGEVKPATR